MDTIYHSKILEIISVDDFKELVSYECNLPFVPHGTVFKYKGNCYTLVDDCIILDDGFFRHVFYVKDINK